MGPAYANLATDSLLKKVLCFLVNVLVLKSCQRSSLFDGVLPYLQKDMLKRLRVIDVDRS
jgi:hypothetical protein